MESNHHITDPENVTSAQRWKMFAAAIGLLAFALVAGYYAVRETRQALRNGYIDVGVKRNRHSSEWLWQARHDRAASPIKFYIHVLRPISLFLFPAMLCITMFIQLLALSVGGPLSQPSGNLRVLHHLSAAMAAIAGLYWLFFLYPLS